MDEKEVQKKLDEIKQTREKYKSAATPEKKSPARKDGPTAKNGVASERPREALSEEDIEKRMKEWRDKPDSTCEQCGVCSIDNGDGEPD